MVFPRVSASIWIVRGNRDGGFTNVVFGGWQFSPILILQGGLPLTVVQSQLLNLGDNRNSRPNRIANGTLPAGPRTVNQWFRTSAFVTLQTDPTQPGFVPFQAFGNSGVWNSERTRLGEPGFQSFEGISDHRAASFSISN
jgi:hypothetical protein